MKERPIIFNGEMVRAILDRRKTQTRRVIKQVTEPWAMNPPLCAVRYGNEWTLSKCIHTDDIPALFVNCPYGQPGDKLWVRETFQYTHEMNQCSSEDSYAIYRATDPDWETMEGWKWKPSIHMPRWASRITLEVTGVRVERVQDISKADAVLEGVRPAPDLDPVRLREYHTIMNSFGKSLGHYRYAFYLLWDSINAKRGYGWDENPWVWVIEFNRLEEVPA